MKLKEALKLETLQGAKVVAGSSALENVISDVNIIDAPDIVNWAREGEFMLTTGYCFKDNEEMGKQIIEDLFNKKCVGLGIKTKRFFDTIPESMVQFCDKINFPLIELPYNKNFSEISVAIYREILHKQAAKLSHSMEINYSLTQVVLKGGGLRAIVDTLSELLDRPVSILDSDYYLQCTSMRGLYSDNMVGRFQDGYCFEPLAKRDKFPVYKSKRMVLEISQESVKVWVNPVRAGKDLLGFIVIWGDTELSELDLTAAEQGAIVTALELVKDRAVAATKHRIRDDFFDDLLSGKIESQAAVSNLGAIHGLDVSKQYVCIVVWVENYAKLSLEKIGVERENLRKITRNVVKIIEKISEKSGHYTVNVIRGNKVMIFLALDWELRNNSKKYSKEFCKNLYEEMGRVNPEIEVLIGIGNLKERFLDTYKSFNEALQAIDMINKIGGSPIAHYDDFTVYNLLESAGGEMYLRELYEKTVKKLEQYDLDKQANLVATLETFLACGGNASNASRELFIHRNTLNYRLEKIEEILNVDLNNQEEILNLLLGLKARRLLQSKR